MATPPTKYRPATAPRRVFVYGTLRDAQGCWNRTLWAGREAAVLHGATVDGLALYGTGFGFPYAVEDPAATIVGDLLLFDDDQWPGVMQSFDTLEGYPSHYDRIVVDVNTPTGNRLTAWVYVYRNADRRLSERDRIVSGDWLDEVALENSSSRYGVPDDDFADDMAALDEEAAEALAELGLTGWVMDPPEPDETEADDVEADPRLRPAYGGPRRIVDDLFHTVGRWLDPDPFGRDDRWRNKKTTAVKVAKPREDPETRRLRQWFEDNKGPKR